MSTFALLALTLALTGTQQPDPNWVSGLPQEPVCSQAQRAVPGVVTSYLIEHCALRVSFASGEALLAFADARLAAGQLPTNEVLRADDGLKYGVHLLVGVEDGQDAPRATEAELHVLQDAFVETHFANPTLTMNSVGITLADGGPALSVGFETKEGLRAFLAQAVARGESPAPLRGVVDGRAVQVPLLLEVIGQIIPQPVGSISN